MQRAHIGPGSLTLQSYTSSCVLHTYSCPFLWLQRPAPAMPTQVTLDLPPMVLPPQWPGPVFFENLRLLSCIHGHSHHHQRVLTQRRKLNLLWKCEGRRHRSLRVAGECSAAMWYYHSCSVLSLWYSHEPKGNHDFTTSFSLTWSWPPWGFSYLSSINP